MLKEGAKAPAFSLESDAGKTVRLSDLAGRWLILYFYPRDSTPGCTREAQGFSLAAKTLQKMGAAVFGVSKDSLASHTTFRDKYELAPLVGLLSDPTLATHKAYGAYGEKTSYGKKTMGTIRSTFLIDPAGKVAKIFSNVKVDGHVDKVIAALKELSA